MNDRHRVVKMCLVIILNKNIFSIQYVFLTSCYRILDFVKTPMEHVRQNILERSSLPWIVNIQSKIVLKYKDLLHSSSTAPVCILSSNQSHAPHTTRQLNVTPGSTCHGVKVAMLPHWMCSNCLKMKSGNNFIQQSVRFLYLPCLLNGGNLTLDRSRTKLCIIPPNILLWQCSVSTMTSVCSGR